MPFPNIFDPTTAQPLLDRLAQLQPTDRPQWGQMTASQMVAHLNTTFAAATNPHPRRPPLPLRLMLGLFFKKMMVNDKPFPRSLRTAPEMIIRYQPDMEAEKARLLAYLQQIQADGGAQFDNKTHPAFGYYTRQEWSNMLYKHMDHHLKQFGK